jgi:hypothetical protein
MSHPLLVLSLLTSLIVGGVLIDTLPAAEPVAIGDRLELFVDRHLIESIDGAELRLHSPRPAEIALKFDVPWERAYSGYVTVFRDGDKVRMYYRGWPEAGKEKNSPQYACMAESDDGITFTRPNVGLVEFNGSKANNIVYDTPSHNFTPFKDTRPGCPEDERYKAVQTFKSTTGLGGLAAYVSPDGIHWRQLGDKPVMTKGAFDSQNLAYWDTAKQEYRCYYRIFTNKVRAVAVATSQDFRTWSEPTPIDLGDAPAEHFYTNATTPYFRAPHYYFSFPKRYVPARKRLEGHDTPGISDGVFMSSRDGIHFDRTFLEAFIRPGRDQHSWGDRSNMTAWGIIQTAPDEMSVYYSQNYRYPDHHMRRGVLRLDGIASLHAGAKSGELITKPITFRGEQLVLNYATSAAGSVRIELQDAAGKPLPGYTLDDAVELYGDQIAEAYRWKQGADVSKLAGQPIRVRFVVRDGDVYSYRFGK